MVPLAKAAYFINFLFTYSKGPWDWHASSQHAFFSTCNIKSYFKVTGYP